MNRSIRWIAYLSLAAVLFTACASSEHDSMTNPVSASKNMTKSDDSRVRSHWVQNDQLQLVMKKLGSTSAANWPSSLPDDPEVAASKEERDKAFASGADLASDLAEAASNMPKSIQTLSLSDADRGAFDGTANLLKDQARMLGKAARRHNVEDMQRQLDAIRATCNSCHTRFKDISGALPPRA